MYKGEMLTSTKCARKEKMSCFFNIEMESESWMAKRKDFKDSIIKMLRKNVENERIVFELRAMDYTDSGINGMIEYETESIKCIDVSKMTNLMHDTIQKEIDVLFSDIDKDMVRKIFIDINCFKISDDESGEKTYSKVQISEMEHRETDSNHVHQYILKYVHLDELKEKIPSIKFTSRDMTIGAKKVFVCRCGEMKKDDRPKNTEMRKEKTAHLRTVQCRRDF